MWLFAALLADMPRREACISHPKTFVYYGRHPVDYASHYTTILFDRLVSRRPVTEVITEFQKLSPQPAISEIAVKMLLAGNQPAPDWLVPYLSFRTLGIYDATDEKVKFISYFPEIASLSLYETPSDSPVVIVADKLQDPGLTDATLYRVRQLKGLKELSINVNSRRCAFTTEGLAQLEKLSCLSKINLHIRVLSNVPHSDWPVLSSVTDVRINFGGSAPTSSELTQISTSFPKVQTLEILWKDDSGIQDPRVVGWKSIFERFNEDYPVFPELTRLECLELEIRTMELRWTHQLKWVRAFLASQPKLQHLNDKPYTGPSDYIPRRFRKVKPDELNEPE